MRMTIEEFSARFPEHDVSREFNSSKITSKSAPKVGGSKSSSARSALEESFAQQIAAMRLPNPHREFVFHPERKWRMDFAWPELGVAVELEGGIWKNGRHTRPRGFLGDVEKYNAATELGWKVLRFTGKDIRDGGAVKKTSDLLLSVERTPKDRPAVRASRQT